MKIPKPTPLEYKLSEAEAEAEWHNRHFCLEQVISNLKRDKAELVDENERLKEQIKQIHKDLGYEMRDPNGTIWQECARLQKENKELTYYLERICECLDYSTVMLTTQRIVEAKSYLHNRATNKQIKHEENTNV